MSGIVAMPLIHREPVNPGPGRGTLLVVDDSRTALSVMGSRLMDAGFLALMCDNGVEALERIAAGGIDLVLLDRVMPGTDGMAVLREIRNSPDGADLPVIMVTGRSEPAAAAEALNAGADDYVAKPFADTELLARIERTLERARRIKGLCRANATLDARIAHRAIELGETRRDLADVRADRARLAASLKQLNDRYDSLMP